ncbi:MAG: hypothetical protein LQ338_001325 [Usnochroma carphineum]|nr:MAG: hypothetical protein LQ338_001325 [Usnochroma carphineum]
MSSNTDNPSMLHGHAAYVAGAAKSSGAETKDAAVAEMRAAKEQSAGQPAKSETMGKVEEKLGGAVGCEGMVDEGKERQ